MRGYKTKISMLSLSAIMALGLVGCGGGGGGTVPASGGATSTTVPGTASDGYLSGSQVCLDMNKNDQCDGPTEPVTQTDANGSYTLTISPEQKSHAKTNAPILIVGGVDIDSHKTLIGSLKAPYSGESTTSVHITPLTTMVMSLVENNVSVDTAYAKVASILNITPDEVKADPVAELKDSNNRKVIAAAMTVNRIVNMMADNDNTEAVYNNLAKSIVKVTASSDANKSITSVVSQAAADTNDVKYKNVAKVLPVVSSTINQAVKDVVDNNVSLENVTLKADAGIEVVQKVIKDATDNNRTLSDTDVNNVESNVTTTVSNADPIKIAVENVLTSYELTATDTQVNEIVSKFTTSDAVTAEAIAKLNLTNEQSIIASLLSKLTAEQIKGYATSLGYTLTDTQIAEIQAITTTPTFPKGMSKADFAKLLYNTGDADLMKVSLELTNPSILTDVEKAKKLLTDLRTQAMSVSNVNNTGFADKESANISDSVNNMAMDAGYVATMLDVLNNGIAKAMDNNQTTISATSPNGTRTLTLTDNSTDSDVIWKYDINSSNEKIWSGSLTYTNVDPDNFDPSHFTQLNAHLTGTLPLGEVDVNENGVTDEQSIDATVQIDSVDNGKGANFTVTADISSNGDFVKLTNLSAYANYNTQYDENGSVEDVVPNYVKVNGVTIDGKSGKYELKGDLKVNAYTQNTKWASEGFEETVYNSGVYAEFVCPNNAILDVNNITFNFNGSSYLLTYSGGTWSDPTGSTHYQVNIWNINDVVTYADASNVNNYSNIDCNNSQPAELVNSNYYTSSWDDLYNSGYLPSDVTFTGSLTDGTTTVADTTLNVKWTNVATIDMDAPNSIPTIDATLSATLQMPSNPAMKLAVTYSKKADDSNVVHATYAYDTTAITTDANLDTNLTGTLNISSATGVKAVVKVIDGDIDYTNSTLTDTNGTKIGDFRDMSGVPSVKFIDGSFVSLP